GRASELPFGTGWAPSVGTGSRCSAASERAVTASMVATVSDGASDEVTPREGVAGAAAAAEAEAASLSVGDARMSHTDGQADEVALPAHLGAAAAALRDAGSDSGGEDSSGGGGGGGGGGGWDSEEKTEDEAEAAEVAEAAAAAALVEGGAAGGAIRALPPRR
ncbi:MAG: hypothetical protein ACK4ZJ_17875, partial [Allorhizobium sp.]